MAIIIPTRAAPIIIHTPASTSGSTITISAEWFTQENCVIAMGIIVGVCSVGFLAYCIFERYR